MKPGYKTTEFWLSFVAALVGFALASGVIEGSETLWDDKIVGFIGSVLTALGYTVSRGIAKRAGS